MRFKVSCELEYEILQPSTLILNVHAQRSASQSILEEKFTKGVQNPAKTLELASGSCRDMATLMMDAARVLGIAARFASGYLDCPASEAGRASMRAWTEFYLPALGWRGYDPTIGEPTSLKHVTTGVSNHPRGVMPVSGMFVGASSDYRELVVQVTTEKLPNPTIPNPEGSAI
jgi:transglutaminase-like putative cysteine protease